MRIRRPFLASRVANRGATKGKAIVLLAELQRQKSKGQAIGGPRALDNGPLARARARGEQLSVVGAVGDAQRRTRLRADRRAPRAPPRAHRAPRLMAHGHRPRSPDQFFTDTSKS